MIMRKKSWSRQTYNPLFDNPTYVSRSNLLIKGNKYNIYIYI